MQPEYSNILIDNEVIDSTAIVKSGLGYKLEGNPIP